MKVTTRVARMAQTEGPVAAEKAETGAVSVSLHRRINKVIGQCNGIVRMFERKLPCEDILLQVSAAKNALHRAGQLLLETYLRQCLEEGVKSGDVTETTRRFSCAIDYFCANEKAPKRTDEELASAESALSSLRGRIEKVIAQCNSILRLVDRDASCEDILTRVSAAKSGLHRVGQVLLELYLHSCIREGVKFGDSAEVSRRYARAVEYFCRQSK